MTVIFVTHEPDIAAFAQRKLALKDGAIVGDVLQQSARAPLPESHAAMPGMAT